MVLAAGAWSRRLGHAVGADVPVRPVRGWLALLAPGPPMLRHAVHEAGYEPVPDPRPARAVSLERLATGGLAAAGADSAHALGVHQNAGRLGERGRVAVGRAARGARERRGAARERRPRLPARARPGRPRGGHGLDGPAALLRGRPPYIGRLDERTFVCAGHGSEGILTGGGSGRLVAELVLGREPFTDPAPFDPARPRA